METYSRRTCVPETTHHELESHTAEMSASRPIQPPFRSQAWHSFFEAGALFL